MPAPTVRATVAALLLGVAALVACADGLAPGRSERPVTFMQLAAGGWQIYRVGLDGAAPQLVPLPQSSTTYPAVSPDGRFLAYLSEGDVQGLFVQPLDGGPSRGPFPETFLNRIAWSPDGDQLILAIDDPPGIRLLTLADGRTRDIGLDLREPAWSPDGTIILATTAGFGRAAGIYRLRPDSGAVELVVAGGALEVRDPAWSPDGSRIAFARGTWGASFIFSARPDGSDVRQLTRADRNQSTTDLKPVWAPDGAYLAFQREHPTCDTLACPHRYDIFVVRPDGSGLRMLTGNARWGGVVPSW